MPQWLPLRPRTRSPNARAPSTKFEQRRELLCNGGRRREMMQSVPFRSPTMKESTTLLRRRWGRGGDSRKNGFPGTLCVSLFLVCAARVAAGQKFEDDFLLRESVSAADPRTAREIFDGFERKASLVVFHIYLYLWRIQQVRR